MTDSAAPWYRRPGVLAVVALLVLAAGVGIGLFLSADDDDGVDTVETADSTPDTTVSTTAPPPPPTTAVTTTTSLSAEERCAVGDQEGCDELSTDRLRELCDEGQGNVDACQVLLAREGDGEPDGPDGEGGNGNGNGNDNGDGDEDD